MLRRALAALVLSLAPIPAQAETPSRGVIQIESGDEIHTIQIEIADEPLEHSRGLMFRDALADASGMLFIYPSPRRTSFWMKNTKISLDMLFIDAEGRIVKIAPETTPFSLENVPSGGPVIGVLEIDGGDAERLGIEVGDTARWLEFPAEKSSD